MMVEYSIVKDLFIYHMIKNNNFLFRGWLIGKWPYAFKLKLHWSWYYELQYFNVKIYSSPPISSIIM
jgi:hypothetical protein